MAGQVRARWRAVVATMLLGLVSCSSEPTDGRRDVGLSFIQQRIDEGTAQAQLRVLNRGARELAVHGVGLDWSGYGDRFLQPYVTTVAAGHTLDLRITLPAPACANASGHPHGVLRLDDDRVVRRPLDAQGRDFLLRVWRRMCAEQYVARQVALAYGDRWRVVPWRGSVALAGPLVAQRRAAEGEVHVRELLGSVLLDTRLARPLVMRPGDRRAASRLLLIPTRCDQHALGQSTQSFNFRATVQVGADDPVTVLLVPGRHLQRRALAMLFAACGFADAS